MKRVWVLIAVLAMTSLPLEFAHAQAAAMMAQQAKKKDDNAKMASMAMAAAMAAMCNQPQGNVAPCIMAALAMMQKDKSESAGKGAGQTAQALSIGGGGGSKNPDGTLKDDDPRNGAGGETAMTGQVKEQLRANGATISPDGSQMMLPDGSTVPLNSSMSTEAGMRSAGLSDAQIAMGQQSLAEALQKIGPLKGGGRELVGDSSGGGGGSSGGYSGGHSRGLDPKPPIKGPIKSSKASGLSKNFHGDKIGVAADDIFEMISNRYKTKEANNTFLE